MAMQTEMSLSRSSIRRRLAVLASSVALFAAMMAFLGITAGPAQATVSTLSIFAGTGFAGTPTPGPATSSNLDYPQGIAVDSLGNVYIADARSHEVEKVTPAGILSIFAGTGVAGTPTPGPATSSKLNYPQGIAVDSLGNVYIADLSNSEVYKVTPTGTLSIFAGTGSIGPAVAGPATSSQLGGPSGLAVDSLGNVYISDSDYSEVYKVTPAGILSIIAGTGTYGAPTPGSATSSELGSLPGLAVDNSGNLYVADSGNNVIEKITPGGTLSIFAGILGSSGAPTPGPATSTTLLLPYGVALDGTGNLYIASEDHLVEEVNTSGILSIFAGNGSFGAAIPGPATSSTLGNPFGVAVSSSGTVYISDEGNAQVYGVTQSTPTPSAPPPPPPNSTSTSLTGSTSSVASGASVTFTAKVDSASGAASGTVTFLDGGTPIISCTDMPLNPSTGTTTCTTSFASSGNESITAAFNGTSLYEASSSSAISLTVGSAVPPTTSPPTTIPPTTTPPTTSPPTTTPTSLPTSVPPTTPTSAPPTTPPTSCPIGESGNPPNCAAPKPPTKPGYIVVTATGGVSPFGSVPNAGSVPTKGDKTTGPVVGATLTANLGGYWLVSADGGVYSFGNAGFFGAADTVPLAKPIVGISGTPDSKGYWLVAADGGVFTYGDAGFYGSCPTAGSGCTKLMAPVVALAPTSDGKGYWEVSSDGGVFAFGNALFAGSAKTNSPNIPEVGIAASAGGGYWTVNANGTVSAFGNAPIVGDCTQAGSGCQNLYSPIVGIQSTPDGKGYWLFGADGGVFTFGSANFVGSATGSTGGSPAV